MTNKTNSLNNIILLRVVRTFLCVTCVCIGFFILGDYRTSFFGLSLISIVGITMQMVLILIPLAFLVFLGCSFKQKMIGASIICTCAFLVVEFFARYQEMKLLNIYGDNPKGIVVVQNRWWPFEDSTIQYCEKYGWAGCD
jgi:hypothetical protein